MTTIAGQGWRHRFIGGTALALVCSGTVAAAGTQFAATSQPVMRETQSADEHFNQGAALRRAGKLDEAIAEYRKAIELDPRNANYHNLLGAALRAADKLDEAEAELRRALALEPESVTARSNLGNLLADQGKFDDAAVEYLAALSIAPENAYLVLRLHLARVSARQNDSQELHKNADRLDRKRWPAPIVALFLGSGSTDTVFAAAGSGSEDAQREQTCEANYYLGSLALRQGRAADARPLLTAAAAQCPPHFVEAVGAQRELKSLPPG